jgi:hypothetical protein
MLKYVRITVTALCLTACVLVIALWVRSYWYVDAVFFRPADGVFVVAMSVPGGVGVVKYDEEYVDSPAFHTEPTANWLRGRPDPSLGMHWLSFYVDEDGCGAPYWLLLLVAISLATAPYRRFWSNRFSLRTLLIATTLVAMALGIVVASS